VIAGFEADDLEFGEWLYRELTADVHCREGSDPRVASAAR